MLLRSALIRYGFTRKFSSAAAAASAASPPAGVSKKLNDIHLLGLQHLTDDYTNVPATIIDKLNRKGLHRSENHPLGIITRAITEHLQKNLKGFEVFNDLSPIVSVEDNFDRLLVPKDHCSRSKSDTYYVNRHTVLRTHTSAHQYDLLRKDLQGFAVVGDVYRRDEIDHSHYPVFHQMEGVYRFRTDDDLSIRGYVPELDSTAVLQDCHKDHLRKHVAVVSQHLKSTLESLITSVLGSDIQMRWIDAYFPFTSPSYELEIFYNDKWMEILGCGIVQQAIMPSSNNTAGKDKEIAWAFGIGLERLAMVAFGIPDIRLFWSTDSRFLDQFKDSNPIQSMKFKPFSNYSGTYKDLSFWTPSGTENFNETDLFELIRQVDGNDWVESVSLVDDYTNKKTGRRSVCYRIMYRHMSRTLSNKEVDLIQERLRERVQEDLKVELR
ncbi:hypothetical protein MP638_001304 [Amoeboaphelidium occidentale]|nr:hypothetical protein MP638_001304 [Amoeboaphelidium occidentale]